MAGGHGNGEGEGHGGGYGRQLAIVVILVGVLVLLHRSAGSDHPSGIDPTALLAFGFVVLASYAIGHLVEVIKLPHITGYLLAGMFFGPSMAHLLHDNLPTIAIAPFDRGVLNEDVISSLSVLDTLAVALIAMTAGGELKIDGLKRGLKAIGGVLIGQALLILVFVTAFVWVVGGAFPSITLPHLGDIDTGAAVALGLVVAAISFATSPAATIAVINDVGAEGPMTRTVLSSVVLKDVFVVVGFSVAGAYAAAQLGMSSADQSLGEYLAVHIGGSIIAGGILGAVMALYLKYVGRELLLVITFIVYAATLFVQWLDPVLLFITVGFYVSNFSKTGDKLIHNVERLSMPVYVVFFTLAGAKLHLDELIAVFPYAATLVTLRAFAMFLGVRGGAAIAGTDPATRKHGWLGFISQAGVAISLASIVGRDFGQQGAAIETLIIAGVALNELIGPVALKVGLGLARETARDQAEAVAGRTSLVPAVEAPRVSRAPEPKREELPPWPEPDEEGGDRWGEPPTTSSPEIDRLLHNLRADLASVVRDVSRGPLERFRSDAEAFFRELRREYLRHHRRLVVGQRSIEDVAGVARLLHAEQKQLAERWRGIVLGRGARIPKRGWSPEQLVDAVDRVVESLPETIVAPYEPESFLPRGDDGVLRGARRLWLRARRRTRSALGRAAPTRKVPAQSLARYHLSGVAPRKLEALAALLVEAETHLDARTRSLFDGIVHGYDRLIEECKRGELDGVARESQPPEGDDDETQPPFATGLDLALRRMQKSVDEELALATEEVERITREATLRAEKVLAAAYHDVREEISIVGTLDLGTGHRRSSKVFKERTEALSILGKQLADVRTTVAAEYALVGLELELVGLESRVKDVLDDHATELERDVRGRAHVQAERVQAALAEALVHIEDEISQGEHTGDQMASTLRQLTEPVEKIAGDASRAALQLHEQLVEEGTIEPLLDALRRASEELTDRYEVPAGRLTHGERRLPKPVGLLEVPFRELVSAYVDTQVAPQLIATARQLADKVQPMAGVLSELERLVAFNVELAVSELLAVPDEPVPDDMRALLSELLLGGLSRSRELVDGQLQASATWPDELGRGLRDAVLGGVDDLRAQLVDGELSQAQIDALRRRVRRDRLRQRAERLPSLLGRAKLLFGRTVRGLVGEDRLERMRITLGLPSRRPDVAPADAFAAPTPADDLPLVYRRLFAAETLEAGDVLTGRDAQIERACRVLGGAGQGALRSVALVGLDGVGKSTLSRAIVRKRAWKHVRPIELTEPASLQLIESWFEDAPEGQLFVISGFHWMVAMRAGGFTPLRRFVNRVIADGGRNAFLIHADRLVWEYASQAAPVTDAFPEVIELRELDAEELEHAVLARHGLSGFGIDFKAGDNDSPLEDLFARGASRIRRPYETYFRALHDASGGLVRDALRLWLASIRDVDQDDDFVHIGPVPTSPEGAVRRLPEDVLLNLYQVSRQGWIHAPVQAHLYRVDEATAEAQLSRLAHLGLLERSVGDTYRIPGHLRGSVYRVLKERGWVK